MRSSRQRSPKGYRSWLGPLAALALSAGLGLLPLGVKTHLCDFLERSFFLPYRFAVGWGPRSLLAEKRADRLIAEEAERHLWADETLAAQAENSRLRKLLGFGRRAGFEFVPATVTGRGREHLGDLLVVEPSNPEAVSLGQAVVVPEGLVGTVVARQGRFARVACLRHLEVAISVLNQRSREGGIVKWNPAVAGLVIEAIPGQTDWRPGNRLVTSGLGLAFPRGVLVGWVVGEKAERGGLLKTILVRPAAPAGRLEEVFLLHPSAGAPLREAEAGHQAGGTDVSALYEPDASLHAWRNLGSNDVGPGPGPTPTP